MSDEVNDLIAAAANKDGAQFKASFDAVIANKVGAALQTQRQDIAKNTFGNIRVANEAAFGFAGSDTFKFNEPSPGKRFVINFSSSKLAAQADKSISDRDLQKIDPLALWDVRRAGNKVSLIIFTTSAKSSRDIAAALNKLPAAKIE